MLCAVILCYSPDRWEHPVDWKFSLLDGLVQLVGDRDPGAVTVLGLQEGPGQVGSSY